MYVCMYVYIVYIASSFIITHLYLEQSSINLTTELTEGIVTFVTKTKQLSELWKLTGSYNFKMWISKLRKESVWSKKGWPKSKWEQGQNKDLSAMKWLNTVANDAFQKLVAYPVELWAPLMLSSYSIICLRK